MAKYFLKYFFLKLDNVKGAISLLIFGQLNLLKDFTKLNKDNYEWRFIVGIKIMSAAKGAALGHVFLVGMRDCKLRGVLLTYIK